VVAQTTFAGVVSPSVMLGVGVLVNGLVVLAFGQGRAGGLRLLTLN
jgi:hypothetical protein